MMFDQITNIIPRIKGVYVVGGSVRDLLLNRFSTDVDIAVDGNPEEFAARMAETIKGHLVRLGKPGQTILRIVSDDHTFDISSLNGPSIEEDLAKRDFTINAMGVELSSGKFIDPLGGRQDLIRRKVRMVSQQNFLNDPIRLLRAYRIAAHLNFQIDRNTSDTILKNAALIKSSAGERIREEFLKILQTPRSHLLLSQMGDSGLLFAIIPELNALKECVQNRYHHLDVFDHSMAAFSHLEVLFDTYPEIFPESGTRIRQSFNPDTTTLLKCAILLHDIAKPLVRNADKQGIVHFYGHAPKSADMAKDILTRLKFSNRATDYITFIIRNHIWPLFLFTAQQKKTLTPKGRLRFYLNCGANTPSLLLHATADMQGKENKPGKHTDAFVKFAEELLVHYFNAFRPQKMKPPLITGHDLINEFQLSPSSIFKKILDVVEEARLSQTIKSKEEALKLVEDFLSRNE
ncbi:CCA tRNA nucleotidyltransferase [Thermodesulfobacteriota bacterium]